METIAFIIKYVLHKFLRIECCHVPSAELIEELEGKRPDENSKGIHPKEANNIVLKL
jgi:hypothetical protein